MLLKWIIMSVGNFLVLSANAQQPEQFSITNMDTARIHKAIVLGNKLSGKHPDSAKVIYHHAWELSRIAGYIPGSKWAVSNLANIYGRESKYDSVRRYCFLAILYSDTVEDRIAISKLYNQIGISYTAQLRFKEAIVAFFRALKFGQHSAYDRGAAYGNLGNVFSSIGNPQRAMYYLNQALPLLVEIKDTSNWCGMLMNIGNVFNDLNKRDSALYFLDSAFRMSERHHLVREFVTTAVNLSDLHLEMGRKFEARQTMDKTLPLFETMILHARERNMLLIQAGKVYAALSQYDIAIDFLQRAKKTVQGDTHHEMVILDALSELYESNGNYKFALLSLRSLYAMQDSLGNFEMASKVNELETQYRTAQKDKTIAEGQLKIQAQELRLNRQRNWVGGAVGSSLLVLLLASWRYTHMRQKNRRLQSQMEVEQLKSEMAGEQKERARIASELHDGIVAELTAIKMNLEVSGNRLPEAPLAYRTHLKELSTVINEVRNTAHNLMPEILLKHGLAEAVGLLCETLEKTGRLKMDYQHYGDFTAISQPIRQSVYRIIQELLHNIIKHAKASKALLQLSSNDGLLTIELEDDGVGMKARSHGSMGLSNIERRVKELRGRVAWSSPAAGSGTQVQLEFDLNLKADR